MPPRRLRVLLLGVLPLVLSGCFGESHFVVFQVSIVNDTQQEVVVRDCDSFCSSSPIAISLQPGASTPINRVAGEHKDFAITTASGEHIGCLDLYFPAPAQGASVDVSQAGSCPGSHARWKTALVAVVILAVALTSLLILGRLRR